MTQSEVMMMAACETSFLSRENMAVSSCVGGRANQTARFPRRLKVLFFHSSSIFCFCN